MFNFFSRPKEAISLWFSTDIHCHVVPGVDDGSPDVATSVSLVQQMRDMGLSRIIASPHVTEVTFENTRQTLDPAFEQLKHALSASDKSADNIEYAAENRIDDLLRRNIDNNTLITHPNNHILIENAYVQEPWDIESVIFNLQSKGYKPIMAHPERFSYYQHKPERLRTLHKRIPFQINLLSLAGYYGKEVRATAEALLDAGMVDFLGTDIHNQKHIDCLRDYLSTRSAVKHRDALTDKLLNDSVF